MPFFPLGREKIKKSKYYLDCSNTDIMDHNKQIQLINKLYLNEEFDERKFLISELKTKLNSYKQQDIKKDLHDISNIITLDDIVSKLVISKLSCYYCLKKIFVFFDKVRDQDQWTLDRINNYDEHTNNNTIISCLGCNLQRRRKNSEKFRFSKQLETRQIKVDKL